MMFQRYRTTSYHQCWHEVSQKHCWHEVSQKHIFFSYLKSVLLEYNCWFVYVYFLIYT